MLINKYRNKQNIIDLYLHPYNTIPAIFILASTVLMIITLLIHLEFSYKVIWSCKKLKYKNVLLKPVSH